jgi:hypothetical protein
MHQTEIVKPSRFLARLASRLRALKYGALRSVVAGCWRFKAACDSARLSLDECATRRWVGKLPAAERKKLIGVVIELQLVDGITSKDWLGIIARGSRFCSKPGDAAKWVQAAAGLRKHKGLASPETQIERN